MTTSGLKRRTVAWSLAMVTATTAVAAPVMGCYGSFALTDKVYDWNGGISNKYIKSAVFLALVIVPVYELTLLGDAVIFNLLEFWTGSNPIATVVNDHGGVESVVVQRDGRTFELRWTTSEQVEISVDGETVGVATTDASGALAVADTDHASVTLDAGRVKALLSDSAQVQTSVR